MTLAHNFLLLYYKHAQVGRLVHIKLFSGMAYKNIYRNLKFYIKILEIL